MNKDPYHQQLSKDKVIFFSMIINGSLKVISLFCMFKVSTIWDHHNLLEAVLYF